MGGDIYAFGITALQLTYGSPPQIEATDVLQGQVTISTEMYERVCPFNKAFESLIKECCGPLAERLSVNQLVEHKFFKGADCPNPEAINKFLGHILQSTERRINSEIDEPPPSMQQKLKTDSSNGIADITADDQSGNLFAPPQSNENAEATLTAPGSQSPQRDPFSWSFTTTNVLSLADESTG